MADIKGYRALEPDEIGLINEAKDLGIELGRFIEKLKGQGAVDPRWLAAGEMDLQTGLMKVVRSIAKPTTF